MTTTLPTTYLDIEDALMGVQGDLLLLGLAVDAVEERCSENRKPGEECKAVMVTLREDDITALTHSRLNVRDALETLAAAFYAWDRR